MYHHSFTRGRSNATAFSLFTFHFSLLYLSPLYNIPSLIRIHSTMIRRIIGTSAVFIGAIVGAGFATGKEICVYFADCSVLAPILASIFLGLFCCVFMLLGRRSDNILFTLFFKAEFAAKIIVVISNFIIFATMIAGAELIFRDCFFVKGIGILSGILAIFFIGRGGRALSIINTILVPIIIAVLIYFVLSNKHLSPSGGVCILPPLAYASMNLLTGGYLVAGYAKEASIKQCLLTSLVVTVVSAVLLVAVYLTAQKYASYPMPLYEYAKGIGGAIGAGIMIFAAIFTTMTASLRVVSDGCYSIGVAATALAFIVSLFGFSNLVTYAYPVIGYIGVAFTIWAVIVLLFKPLFDKRNRSVHKASQHAQSDGSSHNKVKIEYLRAVDD